LKRSKTLLTTKLTPDAARDGPGRRFWQAGLPFVLLDDARTGGKARLYHGPRQIVQADQADGVKQGLDRLRRGVAGGAHATGFLSYDAGHALERKLAPLRRDAEAGAPPLLWFGLFDGFAEVDAAALLPDPAGAWAARPRPHIEQADYEAAVAQVQAHILAGNIYQANLTFQAEVATAGHPLAVYAALRARALAGWSAVVFTGAHWLLSFSPELFFTIEGRRIVTRPMKGTAAAGADPEDLRGDPKQRAENLMIVDLLRNDLSRVAEAGSVEVPALFDIEDYPTVQQMTSTVTAMLAPGLGPVDVLAALFPCGSITGAPKIRAMEIVDVVETVPRGVYTGAIGRLAPGGDAEFNVAIRTLTLKSGESRAEMGLGSGIVADSRAADEWRECLAKGAFVETGRSFDLIETMRFDPEDGITQLERHLARMKRSADAFGFAFDRHHARNELQAATFFLRAERKLRLLLSRSGAIAIETRAIEGLVAGKPGAPIEVALAPLPVEPEDFRLRHKTSDRGFYDDARRASGAAEVLFVDPEGFLTEGSFTSLFVEQEGRLLTPPLARGLLPGILRERLIEEGRAIEAELRVENLSDGFYMGNAVRGLIAAKLSGEATWTSNDVP
jgi:para-aminobenzoate synthetase/4-amino-4-deoxychorismate lyase